MTRPDAAREVARQIYDPLATQWRVVNITHHPRETQALGLLFREGKGLDIPVYPDADFARN